MIRVLCRLLLSVFLSLEPLYLVEMFLSDTEFVD